MISGTIFLGLLAFAFVRHLRHKMNKLDANKKWELTQAHGGYIRDSDVVTRANPLSGRQKRLSNTNIKANDRSDLDSFFTMNTAFSNNQSNLATTTTTRKSNIKNLVAARQKVANTNTKRNSMLANTLIKFSTPDTQSNLSEQSSSIQSLGNEKRLSNRVISAGLNKLDTSRPQGNNPLVNRAVKAKADEPSRLETMLNQSQSNQSQSSQSQSAVSRPSVTFGRRESASEVVNNRPTFSINLDDDDDDDDDDNGFDKL